MPDPSLVRELYVLGLSVHTINRLIDLRHEEIVRSVDAIESAGGIYNRPQTKEEIFAAVIRCYALIMTSQRWCRTTNKQDPPFQRALAKWLCETEILGSIRGMTVIANRLVIPQYDASRIGYVRLLEKIFRGEMIFYPTADTSFQQKGDLSVWYSLLDSIAQGRRPPPTSRDEIDTIFAQQTLNREQIMPIWDDMVFDLVDQMLGTLTPREQFVVRRRFGIDHETPHTFEDIGELMFVTRVRVSQIERKAMRKLAHQVRNRNLNILVEPVGKALQERLTERAEAETKAAALLKANLETSNVSQRCIDSIVGKALFVRLDSVDLSVRTKNCLTNAELVYIGDVAQTSEPCLLRTKNFGRKSLKEIKEILAELGLTLSMSDQLPSIRAFNTWRATAPQS